MVDRVSGSTKWIQHGTVLADWQNTRTYSVLLLVAGQQLLGQGIGDFFWCSRFLGQVFAFGFWDLLGIGHHKAIRAADWGRGGGGVPNCICKELRGTRGSIHGDNSYC